MQGTCLCEAVSMVAEEQKNMTACHCGMCRRWSGGPMLTVHCGGNVGIEGGDFITVFRSSEWAERAFCSKCGTHLYYYLIPADDYIVPAGFFQDGVEFEFREQVFVDEKPRYYDFSNQTGQFTGAQVFARYAP